MDLNFSKTSFLGLVIRENRVFILPFLLFAALFLILLGIYGNHQLFLYFNSYHSSASDFIFLCLTNLGDGLVAALLILFLLWISYREALTFLVITLIITILVNLFKDYLFPELNRPVAFFGTSQVLHLIPGYKPPMLSTFPSGHTATAFSVGLYLSFLLKNRLAKFCLFVLAFFVGYSRIYLSAHFPADVVAGAFFAVAITLICYTLSRGIASSWLDKKIEYIPQLFVRRQKA